MNIFLDRSKCKRQAGCEACFSNHLLCEDFDQADCCQALSDTQRPELVFRVRDRDQSIKTFVVNDENRNLARSSWIWLWEQQAGPVI